MTRKDRMWGLLWASLCGGGAGLAIDLGWYWFAGASAVIALTLSIMVARGDA